MGAEDARFTLLPEPPPSASNRAPRAEAGLASALDAHSPVGVLHWDAQLRFTGASPRGCALLDRVSGELRGRTLGELALLGSEHEHRVLEFAREVLRTGEARKAGPTPTTRRDGSVRHLEWTLCRLESEGRTAGLACLLLDVTERVALEGELEALRGQLETAARLKDEFLATLSHELRTPLTAILGWVQMLKRSAAPTPTMLQKALGTIERSARSQARIVEDVLDISRIVTGRLQVETRPVNLFDVVQGAVDTLRPTAEARSISFDVELDPNAGLTLGDAQRLQQVAWNLLANALKFTPCSGRVCVKLERSGDWLVLTVEDTGQGIDAEVLPHIFERFRQGDGSATRLHGGLGVGLALVRHLVELHGGEVSAQSRGRDQGATFTVRLPLRVRDSITIRSRTSQPPGLPSLSGLEVLVVAQEAETRELLELVLSSSGAKPRCVPNARGALEALQSRAPDVLVCDVVLSEVDGFSLLRQVRALPVAQGGRTPALALTQDPSRETARTAFAAGFQRAIPQPVEVVRLLALVGNLGGRVVDGE